MGLTRLFAATLLCCFVLAHSDGGNVLELTDANFAEVTGQGRWFIKFYAPWCGWCKKLAPVWDFLGEQYNVRDDDLYVGKVDCTAQPKACATLEVKSFPTLRYLAGGKVYDFNGADRSLQTLKKFVEEDYKTANSYTNPFSPEAAKEKVLVSDQTQDIARLTEQNFFDLVGAGRWLVAATAPWCGHCKALHPKLETLASQKDSVAFGVANIDCDEDGDLCRQLGTQGFPTIMVIEDGYRYMYNGDREVASLKRFAQTTYVDQERTPLHTPAITVAKRGRLSLLDDNTFEEATANDPWLIGFTCQSKNCKDMEAALEEVQKSYTVHLRVGLVECARSLEVCKEYKVEESPSVILFYRERTFVYNKDTFGPTDLATFVSDDFKQAPAGKRRHVGMKRRLDWNSVKNMNWVALEDFLRKHRYLLAFCFFVTIWIWGIFVGSCLAHSPVAIRDMLQRDARRMRQLQQEKSKKKTN